MQERQRQVSTVTNILNKFLGKILQDANTVESYHIEEKGFIVCMIQKVSLKIPSTPLYLAHDLQSPKQS